MSKTSEQKGAPARGRGRVQRPPRAPRSVRRESRAVAPIRLELPAPTSAERAALRGSLQAEGLLEPIVVSSGPACTGEVAEGRVRRELCTELGIECAQRERPFASREELVLFRLTVNLKRRQLSPAERIRI